MSKSLVEKYEQILAADPSSTAFVELARALIDRGDNARAMAICEQGLQHHPKHVVGRVLLGKALINGGRAAEAMAQFEVAMSAEKEHPHAYNLIAEVLLRKSLYRSALPILRKAAALQPGDRRILQWVEQTKAALSGGPVPVLYDNTVVDASALSDALAQAEAPDGATAPTPVPRAATDGPLAPPVAPTPALPLPPADDGAVGAANPTPQTAPMMRLADAPELEPPGVDFGWASGLGPPVPNLFPPSAGPWASPSAPTNPAVPVQAAPPALDGEPATDSHASAFVPGEAESRRVTREAVDLSEIHPRPQPATAALDSGARDRGALGRGTAQPPVPTGESPMLAGGAGLPSLRLGRSTPTEELSLDGERDNAPASAPGAVDEAPDPFSALSGTASGLHGSETLRGLTSTFNALEEQGRGLATSAPPVPRPSAIPPPGGPRASSPRSAGGALGLLDDVASAQSEIPTSELALPSVLREATSGALGASQTSASGRRLLLAEVPDDVPVDAPAVLVAPKAEEAPHHVEAIGKEYEQELRRKFEARALEKTFLQEYGRTLALAATVVVVVGGLGGSFLFKRLRHQGESLDSAVGKGLVAANADTREQYAIAQQMFDNALKMDDSSVEAWAWKGFVHGVLFAEHGLDPKDRDAARAAFAASGVREARPELALVVDFLTADSAGLAAARQTLLGSSSESPVVQAQMGRVLLDDQKFDDALKHLQRAVAVDGRNVRALVALGDYYLAFEDYDSAVAVLSGMAATLSKFHPRRVMGLAQARLELGRDVGEALSELEGLPKSAQVPKALEGRYSLTLGRVLAASGRHEEAQRTLTTALAAHPELAFELRMALGGALRGGGDMETAQKHFEQALALRPRSELAKEGLARVLLARGREHQLLERLRGEKGARKVALVRGIAWSRLGDYKKSRAELQATAVTGKFPAEAVVYLALADAAEEAQTDKAVAMLEKLATQAKRDKATVQVALARILMQRGASERARAQLEDAAKDPQDYEANTLLGELLLRLGASDEAALEPIARAVERNGSHAPARRLQVRLLLSLGKGAEAAKQADAWVADNPELGAAWFEAAVAYLQTGRFKDAEAALQKAAKPDTEDLEAWRLRARVLFASTDAKAGFAALERANKLNPKDVATFCEIGQAFVRVGNTETALSAYQAALREEPKSFCGRLGRLHTFLTGRATKPSKRTVLAGLLSEARASWDKVSVQATLARVMVDEGKLDEARVTAEAAVAAEPFHPWAWFALGEAQRKLKDDAKALEAYRKAVDCDGSWTSARLQLADALTRAGQATFPQALAEYDLVSQLSQNEKEQQRAASAAKALRRQLK